VNQLVNLFKLDAPPRKEMRNDLVFDMFKEAEKQGAKFYDDSNDNIYSNTTPSEGDTTPQRGTLSESNDNNEKEIMIQTFITAQDVVNCLSQTHGLKTQDDFIRKIRPDRFRGILIGRIMYANFTDFS
jgi:hypothetical protein